MAKKDEEQYIDEWKPDSIWEGVHQFVDRGNESVKKLIGAFLPDTDTGRGIAGAVLDATGAPAVGQVAGSIAYGDRLTSGKGETLHLKDDTTDAALALAAPVIEGAELAARGTKMAAKFLAPQAHEILEAYASHPIYGVRSYVVPPEETSTMFPGSRVAARVDDDVRASHHVETPEFKDWFKDHHPEMVGEDGLPITVYHTTDKDFTQFNTEGGKTKTKNTGSFFSSSPDISATYGTGDAPRTMAAHINLKKPLVIDAEGSNWGTLDPKTLPDVPKLRNNVTSTDDLARWARKNGYDGLIVKNVHDEGPAGKYSSEATGKPSTIYSVFDNTAIKSKTGNRGTWDKHDPNILHGATGIGVGAGTAATINDKNREPTPVTDHLVNAIIHHESSGNPYAYSDAGAKGLMQLMPKTAKELGVTDIYDPKQNEAAGRKYIGQLIAKYDGDVRKALIAYNWGPGKVAKFGVEKAPESAKRYADSIVIMAKSLEEKAKTNIQHLTPKAQEFLRNYIKNQGQ